MKKIIFILTFLIFSTHVFARYDDGIVRKPVFDTTYLHQILALPLQSYIGKPVDSLLSVLPQEFSSRNFMPIGIGYTRGISQSYFTSEFNNCYVEIYIDNFQYLPIPNRKSSRHWSMELAKKETIAFIKVVKNNNVCVYGCSNPNYDY